MAKVSHNSPDGNSKTVLTGRALRYALQAAARHLLPDRRVSWCMRRVRPDKDHVDLMLNADQQAYYKNVMRCGRLWECPVCSARITESRREKLGGLVKKLEVGQVSEWVKYDQTGALVDANPAVDIHAVPVSALGGSPLYCSLITFTLSHHIGETCGEVKARLLSSYRAFTSGRGFQWIKSEFHLLASLKAMEVTHGENGWHVHLHILAVSDTSPNRAWRETLKLALSGRWQDSLARFGGSADWTHGITVVTGSFALATYLAKLDSDQTWTVSDEITKAAVKNAKRGGRTMNRLLYDYMLGDSQAGALWTEGVKALSGHKHLSPSRGFWKLIGYEKEPDVIGNDQLAACDVEAPEDRLLAQLSLGEWKLICRSERRGELLDLAATGDESALWRFIEALKAGSAQNGQAQNPPEIASPSPLGGVWPESGQIYRVTRISFVDWSVTEELRRLAHPPDDRAPGVIVADPVINGGDK